MLTQKDIITSLQKLQSKEVFHEEYYPQIDELIASISVLKKEGLISKKEIREISYYYGKAFLENTLQGAALLKKFGYAGDFLMIDNIYSNHFSDHPFYKSWDKYFQNQAAPKAVRNRKEYFKQLIKNKFHKRKTINLLNIASGPARDLAELYPILSHSQTLKTVCIETDESAIKYAKNLTHDFQEYIEYINANIFQFETKHKFDVIWSAGLFDYFSDRNFLTILKKCKDWCSSNGEIIIGNFNAAHNPTRDYMEIFGEWFLNHRTRKELIELGKVAGFEESEIFIYNEPENVNLFMHLKNTL